MRPFPIPVSEGCEFGKPPDAITRGACRVARNSFYEPESDTLHQLWWRSQFGTLQSNQTPKGISAVRFRNGNRFIVGAAGNKIVQAPMGETGTFTVLKTLASQLGDATFQYNNDDDHLYIMDGVNAPQVWDGVSGATRDMGLRAPTSPLVISLLSNAQTTYAIGSTFQYLITEFDSVNDVESGPGPVGVTAISATGQTIKIALPAKLNASADTFRLYRTQAGGSVWFRMAEFPATLSFYYDGANTDGGTPAQQNTDQYPFVTLDDLFLSALPVMPMVGEPLQNNYVTVNGSIPIGDIALFFQGCLLIAGVDDFPQHVYYSLPGLPECFSPVYFLNESSAGGEPVTGLAIANDKLVTFNRNRISRYDRIPFVTDPGFGTGATTRQNVAEDHGSIAKRAVVPFSVGLPNSRCFYLSNRGPFVTDAYRTIPIGADLDWDKLFINYAAISGAVAVNWPKYRVIILCLPSAGSTVNDFALIYHYDPSHAKRGPEIGKWTGPIDIRIACAAVSHEAALETRLFLGDSRANGQVYLEDNGATDAGQFTNASGDVNWEVETGDVPIGSPTRQTFLGNAFVSLEDTGDYDGTFLTAVDRSDTELEQPLENLTPNEDSTEIVGTTSVTRKKGRTYVAGIYEMASHLRVHLKASGHGTRRHVVSIETEGEDRGPRR